MEFLNFVRNPPILFALIVPALLLISLWMRRGRGVALPFDHTGFRRGHGLWALITLAQSCKPGLLAVAIVIIAGPQKWDEPKSKRRLTNIEFCVDVSGSMNAVFEEGTRYDASMKAIDEFVELREGDAFGMTFFGTSVLHWVPITSDPSALRCSPPFMQPRNLPPWFNGTSIGKALLACRKVLIQREIGDRMIVLVSDGASSDLSGGKDLEIAQRLRDDGIVVYGIHIANFEAPETIVNITSATGGEVFNPGDQAALLRVFHRIDQMQVTEMEKTRAEAIDNYGPWCLAGLFILSLSVLSSFLLRFTPW